MLPVKKGNIVIPLVMLLGMSFCVLFLSRFFSSSQANVGIALDSRYTNSVSLSRKMDPPAEWETYTNTKYHFTVKYPKQWPASTNKSDKEHLFLWERFLSNKVKLQVEVKTKFVIPPTSNLLKLAKNDFHFYFDDEAAKSAVVERGGYFYIITFTEQNYFSSQEEFRGTFYQILKTFQFTNLN